MVTQTPTDPADTPIGPTTLAELKELAGRYPQARSALLPMLHLVQSVQGRVTTEGIETCARILDLTEAEVSAVATFYTMYKRRPMGTHHVGVCTNTLCAVMGGDEIFERLCGHLDVGNDETTADGAITLERVECNAACDFAPVVMVNWEFFDQQTPESAIDLVERLRAGERVASPRGAQITSWREAERVLAGFEDGRVDEGPAAGEASLAGLRIAQERGWQAPSLEEDSGTGRGGETKQEAAAEADTQRAESETVAEQSPADVEGGADDD
ncbi:NADH-quinone oxidoreductase subunit NuoE [Aeromicrobium camelliae]|uniref:NADH-quinone oxidoreductase subunit NuoE n=1 Tax=Aeromicrobium camelliae TaxID=1538144 RepID=A0A3N6X858_9ACTN|nr:NADH-quinone oxidoreductase subunit NuoE [Aeromicrobium camelliae]RQN10215.1 NADH-quinone oxidoreductase subunit NuoE [Aeromicrobium camelliae]